MDKIENGEKIKLESKSWNYEDVFWVHNDSGDIARIFPVRRDGTSIIPPDSESDGVLIKNGSNLDWEDIAFDNMGNIVIGACGNNANKRKDLGIYVFQNT